jgi:hypothetical protein
MAESTHVHEPLTDQRRRIRRTATVLLLLAFGIYLAFIAYAVTRGLHGHG